MNFIYEGQQVLWQGLKSMGPSFQESEDFFFLNSPKKGLVLQIVVSEIFQHSPQPSVALQELLQRFAPVFDTPKGLPPNRGHKHQIVLKEHQIPFSSPVLLGPTNILFSSFQPILTPKKKKKTTFFSIFSFLFSSPLNVTVKCSFLLVRESSFFFFFLESSC